MARPSLDSIAVRESGEDLSVRNYWSDRRRDRLQVVKEVLGQLDAEGWPNRADTGWSEYDIEIFGTRWSQLHLVTAGEDHAHGKQMLRFRLLPRWSFLARTAFGALCIVIALALGLFAGSRPWLWSLLVLLPLFVWMLRRQQRSLQSMIAVLLDKMARDRDLVLVITETSGSPDRRTASPGSSS
jgi:hypothetical protein